MPGGGHHLGRGVTVDGQRILPGIVEITRAGPHPDSDLVAGQGLHRPGDLDLAPGGNSYLLRRGAIKSQSLGADVHPGVQWFLAVVMDDGGDLGLVARYEKAGQHRAHQ